MDGKVVDESEGIYAPGWVDVNGAEADPGIPLGLGFWTLSTSGLLLLVGGAMLALRRKRG